MLSMHPEETWCSRRRCRGAGIHSQERSGSGVRRGDTPGGRGRKRSGSATLAAELLKGETQTTALTPRELEILQLIVEGKSNKEIATQLDLSANTVAVHRANMMDALGIHKTAELVVYAIRNGLVNVP